MKAPMLKLQLARVCGQDLRWGEFQRNEVLVMRRRWRRIQSQTRTDLRSDTS